MRTLSPKAVSPPLSIVAFCGFCLRLIWRQVANRETCRAVCPRLGKIKSNPILVCKVPYGHFCTITATLFSFPFANVRLWNFHRWLLHNFLEVQNWQSAQKIASIFSLVRSKWKELRWGFSVPQGTARDGHLMTMWSQADQSRLKEREREELTVDQWMRNSQGLRHKMATSIGCTDIRDVKTGGTLTFKTQFRKEKSEANMVQ